MTGSQVLRKRALELLSKHPQIHWRLFFLRTLSGGESLAFFVFVSSYLGLLEDMWSFVTATLLLTDSGWAQRFGALSFTTSKRHASKQNVTHVPHTGASPSSSKALEPDCRVATEAWQASHAFRLDA